MPLQEDDVTTTTTTSTTTATNAARSDSDESNGTDDRTGIEKNHHKGPSSNNDLTPKPQEVATKTKDREPLDEEWPLRPKDVIPVIIDLALVNKEFLEAKTC